MEYEASPYATEPPWGNDASTLLLSRRFHTRQLPMVCRKGRPCSNRLAELLERRRFQATQPATKEAKVLPRRRYLPMRPALVKEQGDAAAEQELDCQRVC